MPLVPVTVFNADQADPNGTPLPLEGELITGNLSEIIADAQDHGGETLRLFFGRQVLSIERVKVGVQYRFKFMRGELDAAVDLPASSTPGMAENLARVLRGQALISMKVYQQGFGIEFSIHTLVLSTEAIALAGPAITPEAGT